MTEAVSNLKSQAHLQLIFILFLYVGPFCRADVRYAASFRIRDGGAL